MTLSTPVARTTKYCMAVESIMSRLGHATNHEILEKLRHLYPEVSATTVHRVTARLADRGVLALGPKAKDGSLRYDANTSAHDHFVCLQCDGVRDMHISQSTKQSIEAALGGCSITGQLYVQGTCRLCGEKILKGEK